MILETVAMLAAAAVWGAMFFFSLVVAPLVFIKLPAEVSGPFIRNLFPYYYLVLGALSAVSGIALVRSHPVEAAVLGVVTVAFVLARQVLMPAINHYRDAQLRGDEGADKNPFALLHRLSVVVNWIQFAAVGYVLVRLA